MNKSNVTKWKTAKQVHPPMINYFECPECLTVVPEHDFISSYRLIEGRKPANYQVKNLCRKCRDSGL